MFNRDKWGLIWHPCRGIGIRLLLYITSALTPVGGLSMGLEQCPVGPFCQWGWGAVDWGLSTAEAKAKILSKYFEAFSKPYSITIL